MSIERLTNWLDQPVEIVVNDADVLRAIRKRLGNARVVDFLAELPARNGKGVQVAGLTGKPASAWLAAARVALASMPPVRATDSLVGADLSWALSRAWFEFIGDTPVRSARVMLSQLEAASYLADAAQHDHPAWGQLLLSEPREVRSDRVREKIFRRAIEVAQSGKLVLWVARSHRPHPPDANIRTYAKLASNHHVAVAFAEPQTDAEMRLGEAVEQERAGIVFNAGCYDGTFDVAVSTPLSSSALKLRAPPGWWMLLLRSSAMGSSSTGLSRAPGHTWS